MLCDSLIDVCDLAMQRSKLSGVASTSSDFSRQTYAALNSCITTVREQLAPAIERARWLEPQISRGAGKLPSVFWMSLVPKGRSVSNSLSVSICVGRHGEGIVAGVMNSVSVPRPLRCVPRTNNALLVDVDGSKPETRYNNRFLNPLEIPTHNLKHYDLIPHLSDSLLLLRRIYLVNSSSDTAINDLVASYRSIADGRQSSLLIDPRI